MDTPIGCDVPTLLNSMREGLQVINRDFRYVYLNLTAQQHARKAESELLGRTMMECYPGIETTPLFQQLKRCRDEGISCVIDNDFRYPDGSVGHFELRIAPVPTGLCVLSLDVTERVCAERALREGEARFRTMAEDLQEAQARLDAALRAAGMGTWVWEVAEDRVLFDSPLLRLFGLAPEDAPESRLSGLLALFHEADRERLHAAIDEALRLGEELDVEARIKRTDGSKLWLSCKGRVACDATGQPLRFSGACVDVTQRRRLEDALRQAQKMEAIGKLAGGVAHDFNNLLTVIIGQASLMPVLGELNDSLAEAVNSIAQAADRATGLTSQLLAFGRRQLMQPEELDLNEVIADLLNTVRRIVGEQIRVELGSTPSAIGVRADPNMLTQMLLNLTVNARDAMPRGGALRVSTELVRLDERKARLLPEASAGEWACLSVSDTGAGIPSDVLPHIFEPFFTTKEASKGAGLGLATVYGLVRQHQGFMHVDSDTHGTTFQVFLPRSKGVPTSRAKRSSDGWPRGHGETVLLVEDDTAVRDTVGQILTQHGYRVVLAEDGLRALEVWNEECDAIDLLLTDIVMPGELGGRELAAELSARRPSLKTILTSGYSADTIAEDARPDQVRLLKKPYAADQLLRVVRETLKS